jgi:hypothetical protein
MSDTFCTPSVSLLFVFIDDRIKNDKIKKMNMQKNTKQKYLRGLFCSYNPEYEAER